MKSYTLRFHSKETARAFVGIFIAGLDGTHEDPESQEAIDMATRLGEWSEDGD